MKNALYHLALHSLRLEQGLGGMYCGLGNFLKTLFQLRFLRICHVGFNSAIDRTENDYKNK